MAFNIAYTYQLIDKYTAPIQKIIAATRAHTRYLKENQAAIKASNAALAKMAIESGKTGTAITRLANRSERLNGSLKALQHNNAFDHLTTQARGLNDQIERMHRMRLPGMPGAGGVPGAPVIPGQHNVPGGRAIHQVGGRMSRFGAAASGLTGIGAGVGIASVLKQTAAVENAMIDMGRATNLPSAELKAFEERFMSLSEQIGISTDKLAIMAYEGSKTGIDTKDLDKYVKITANAAVSFEILEQEAGRALGSIKAKMGLNIDQLQKMMDVTNFVADATSADGERMINIIERLSGTFNTLHIKPEIAAGLAAMADQLETSPELAASGLNMVMTKMMKSSAIGKKMFAAPLETMREVFTKLSKLPEQTRIKTALKMFGEGDASRLAIKMASNMALFEDTMKKAADSKALGSMEREMASKLGSLTMLWKNMKNAVTNVMVAIGEGLAPDIKRFGDYMRDLVPKIREFVREHPGVVKFAAAVALIVAAITLAVPIVWALCAAFSFVAAGLALLTWPVVLFGALIAGMIWRWDEWVKSGHPLIKVIDSISGSVGRIIDKIEIMLGKNKDAKGTVDLLAKAFDFLGKMVAKALEPIDLLLKSMEKIIDLSSKGGIIKAITEDPAAAAGAVRGLLPGPARTLMDLTELLTGGGNKSETNVNGTITVKAEPGTKARVSQPNLPTGNNVRIAQ